MIVMPTPQATMSTAVLPDKEKPCKRPENESAAARERRLERARQYRRNNPEKIAALGRRYRLQNSELIKERITEWKRNNKDRVKLHGRRWRLEHPEKLREAERKYRL